MDRTCFTVVLACLLVTGRSQLFQQEDYDYCEPRLKLCELYLDHTMCKYPVAGPSPQCTKGLHEPLSQTEKDRILFLHNKFRSYVASGSEKNKTRKLPSASNMRQLYWDGELETIAARWADQCTSTKSPVTYDKCRNTKRFRVSQNVGVRRINGTAVDKQAPQIVITWYKENKDFDPALVDKFLPAGDDSASMKQFANIIWADTYALGCARVIFQEKVALTEKETRPTVWTTERLVCNYGPAGNEPGKAVYRRGAPCESCPGGTECSRFFNGLCAIQSTNKTEEKTPKENEKPETKLKSATSPPKTFKEASVPTTTLQREEEEEEEKQEAEAEEEEEEEEVVVEEAEEKETCRGGECNRIPGSPRKTLTNLPKATARKKSREVGLLVPVRGKDSISGSRTWTVSDNRTGRSGKPGEATELKDGDGCRCFLPMSEDDSSSARSTDRNPFLLYFSTFIAVETFLFYTRHWNE